MMIIHALRRVRARTSTPTSYRRYLTTIGIRREDPARVWERRAPLTPDAVQSLLTSKKDLAVEVESCERRCFPNRLYHEVSSSVSGMG
jgi:alpha-aminoadipic semialdehyde synthase